MPKKVYRKFRKIRSHGVSNSTTPVFGKYCLKALNGGRLTKNQIEASRKVIMRNLKQGSGILRICIFAHLPVTKKPLEVRMGGGKGPVDKFVANVKAGQVLFEIDDIDMDTAVNSLSAAALKLPIDCKVLVRKFVKF